MGSLKVAVQVEGLNELRAKIRSAADDSGFVKQEWQAGLAELGAKAAGLGQAAAPRGKTGDLAGSVTSRVAKSSTTGATVAANAKHGGYRYGRLLEIAPKYRHRAWLLKAVQQAVADAGGVLSDVARRIEARFAA